MRLSLEEDILNGQGDEWDDILTPSVVHNAESIAQKIDFKDPRQLDFSGIDLHGGNKHLDQNKSGIPLEDEQPETQRVQTIQKEKEESLDSQRTYHVQVYDDQHQIQYAKDDIDMSQEKGQILTKRDRSMPVNDNNDGETIDQFNKMLNESPFSYRRYMRQQDSNSRKAINEQYNSQVANDIIPSFQIFNNIQTNQGGMDSAQFSLRQPNQKLSTALMNNFPQTQNVTININNDTYVNYNMSMPQATQNHTNYGGTHTHQMQNPNNNNLDSNTNTLLKGLQDSDYNNRTQDEILNDRQSNQQRGRTAPFQNAPDQKFRKVSDLISNYKNLQNQGNTNYHHLHHGEVFSDQMSHQQQDNYGLQGLFYHPDHQKQQDGPQPYMPQMSQFNYNKMGATSQSIVNYSQGPGYYNQQMVNRAQSQPGTDIPSKLKTADNFYKCKENIQLYGLPQHMIKSFEKRRNQLRSRESAATMPRHPGYNFQGINGSNTVNIVNQNVNFAQGPMSQASGIQNRTAVSAASKRFQKRGTIPKNLFQRGAMNQDDSIERDSKSGGIKSPMNKYRGRLMSQGSDGINGHTFNNLRNQININNPNQIISPHKINGGILQVPYYSNIERPFSQGNHFQTKSPFKDPYLQTNGMLSSMNPTTQKQNKLRKNALPPLVSPPKLPPIFREFIPIFETNLKTLMDEKKPEVVFLNIYNVSSFNKVSEFLGFGFYHTSVEIYNHEFSYGGHDYDLSGIVCVEAGNCAGLTLREKLPIGVTFYNEDEIDDIIRKFGDFWQGKDYDPFSNNCNCFTEKFISHIVDKEQYYFPAYINRFTKLGSLLRMWFKPLQAIFGDIVAYDEDDKFEEKALENEQVLPYYEDFRQNFEALMVPGVPGVQSNQSQVHPNNIQQDRMGSNQSNRLQSVNKSNRIDQASIHSQNRLGSPIHPGSDFQAYQQQYYNEQMFISQQIFMDQCLQKSQMTKDRGDQFFQNQDYDNGMSYYQQALEYLQDLDTETYPQIREMVTLLLLSLASCSEYNQQYEYVIHYCSQCIEIDQLNERAYQKRANTFLKLGNYIEAKADLEVAYKINPNDLIIIEDLKFIEDQLAIGKNRKNQLKDSDLQNYSKKNLEL